MSWASLDDGFTEHPKVFDLEDADFRLHVAAMCACSRRGTDGFIATRYLPALIAQVRGTPNHQALIDAGLWEIADGGWQIHDWLEYNRPAATVAKQKAAGRERQREWAARQADKRRAAEAKTSDTASPNASDNASANAFSTPTPSYPIPSYPLQEKKYPEFAGKPSLDPRPVEPVSLPDQPANKPENSPPRSGSAPDATPRTRASEPEAVEPKQIALLSDADKRPAPPRQKRASDPAPTTVVWLTYSRAYHKRYGVEPVRNAKVNGQLSQLVSQLGAEEAIDVAAFYLTHDGAFYKQQAHEVGLMLRDAQKLRTELRTGKQISERPGFVPTVKPFDRNDILSQMTRRPS